MSNTRVYLSKESKEMFDLLITALETSVSGKVLTEEKLDACRYVLETGKAFQTSIKLKEDWVGKTNETQKGA